MRTQVEPEQVETPPAPGAIVPAGQLVVLTPDELEKAEVVWQEAIKNFKQRDRAMLENILVNNWEKGQFLEELIREKAKYGNKTVESFAIAMKVSRESAYAWQKFYLKFTPAEMQEAIDLGVHWQVIYNLLSLHESEKARRRELMIQSAEHKINIDDLKKQAASVNVGTKEKLAAAGKKVDKRGGTRLATTFRSTTSMCAQVCAKTDEFLESIREYERVTDPAKKADLAERLKEARKALKTTGENIGRALKRLDDMK